MIIYRWKSEREIATILIKCPQQQITADKRLRYASPKLPSATSFICKALYDIPPLRRIRKYKNSDAGWSSLNSQRDTKDTRKSLTEYPIVIDLAYLCKNL